MRKYNQFYTEKHIGEQLIDALGDLKCINSCVELGVGLGGLIAPLCERADLSTLLTCDIDEDNCEISRRNWPFGFHYNIDVLLPNFEEIFLKHQAKFDLALCNPPFGWIDHTEYTRKILMDNGILSLSKNKSVRMEVLFVIQNLRLISLGGSFGVILPELIIKSKIFEKFRSVLKEMFQSYLCIENEAYSFRGTEATTYLLVLKDKLKCLYELRDDVEFSEVGSVKINRLPEVDIKRGRLTGKECRATSLRTLHTTDFRRYKEIDSRTKMVKKVTSLKEGVLGPTACNGDVVIARVGTRILGEALYINNDEFVISDCVFRVRFGCPDVAKEFLRFWVDNKNSILNKHSSGTCAKYITISCLQDVIGEFFSVVECRREIRGEAN